jgi:prolipoprotein diacylglyceryl transferase
VAGLPIRAYAMCILAGIVVAIVVGEWRWRARGGQPGVVMDISVWAVPFGVVGGRLYHVVTSPDKYFGATGDPARILRIWEGGLGIWGAVALGGVGAWIGCRRAGVRLPPMADALAPGIVFAQAVGRWGNWFNNELYGKATDLPRAIRIHEWNAGTGRALRDADGEPVVLGTYHPTFLYECVWNLGVGAVLLWVDRRYRIGHGRVFALYVMLYTVGRAWVEALRIDASERILGLRLNIWTSLVVFLCALAYFLVSMRTRPGREDEVRRVPGTAESRGDGEPPEPSEEPNDQGESPTTPAPGDRPAGSGRPA